MQHKYFAIPFVAAVLVLLAAALFVPAASPAYAAQPQPLLMPTPVAVQPVMPTKLVFPIFNGTITDSVRVGPINFSKMRIADIQYAVDVSDTQTVTARLDYSNDNRNWVTGPTIINGVAADGTDMQEFYTFGGYGSVTLTLATSLPVTVSIYAAGQ